MRSGPTLRGHSTFAQVCSSGVTKEYRLSESSFRLFVNLKVPTLRSPALDLLQFEAQAE
jgi:hypothetical protein